MGGSGRLRIGDARTPIVPDSDLGLQGSFPLSHIASSDVDPVLAVLTAQSPIGPKLLRCDVFGNLVIVDDTLAGVVQEFTTGFVSFGTETFNVPVNKRWRILPSQVIFAASLAVGNRLPIMTARDAAGNVMWEGLAVPMVIAAAEHIYQYGEGLTRADFAITGIERHDVPVPQHLIIDAGGAITLTDNFAVDPAGDAWKLTIRVLEADA